MDNFIQRPRIYTKHAVPVLRWTAFSLVVSIGFVEIMGFTVAAGGQLIWQIILGVAWVLALGVPLISVGLALKHSFTPQARKQQVVAILASYLGLIASFGGAYYSMSALADRIDAREQHEYYGNKANYIDPAGNKVERVSSRALAGIERRLWSAVDWPNYDRNYLRDEQRTPVSFSTMIRTAREPLNEVSRFQPDARLNVLGNSMYFSVVTITTLGYGDIAPQVWFAKVAAAIQSVCGLVLLYFSLSMVISGWYDKPSQSP